jgi:hypothetical protein
MTFNEMAFSKSTLSKKETQYKMKYMTLSINGAQHRNTMLSVSY